MDAFLYAISVVVAYLIGSLSPGLLIGKLVFRVDIRKYGSGSSGATNVYRNLGRVPAAAVVVSDVLKGVAAVGAAHALTDGAALALPLAGVAAIAGHSWPLFAGFQGGRGVMTGWGATILLSPPAAAITAVGFIIVAVTRYASIGSLIGTGIAAVSLTVLAALGRLPAEYVIFAVFGALLIFGRHWPNIIRLIHGRERRLDEAGRPTRASKPRPRTRHG